MPFAVTNSLPPSVKAISNTRLILAADGSRLLVDCGGTNVLDHLKKLREAGTLTADITTPQEDFREWIEAMVRILP
jgi:hypothetical protein